MNVQLFKEWGLLYRPNNAFGWALTILVAIFSACILLFTDIQYHSAADTFYGAFPYVFPAILGLYVFAMRTSQPPSSHACTQSSGA